MTCENPRFILNTTKKFNGQLTKVGFYVPCGECESCRQAMRDEWFVRAYAEWKDITDKGGKVYFPTLTYAPKSLPLFNTKTGRLCHDERKYGKYDYCVPCFSKSDIKRYINTMRKTFERLGLKGVRYLVCSEFGETTQRPHYHCLIYVPRTTLSDSKVQDVLLDSWKFGIAFWSELGAEIQSLKGVLYVTKYACKDVGYCNNDKLKRFSFASKSNRKTLGQFMPFHLQSKGFGLDLYKWLSDKENVETYIDRGVGADFLGLACTRQYPIPRYIRNKIMYTTDENGNRIPSEMGHLITMKMLHLRIESAMRNYSKFFTPQGLRSKIDDEDCRKVIEDIERFRFENSLKGLREFLFEKLNGRTLRELAIYKYCYRNLIVDDKAILDEADTLSVDELESVGYALTDESFDQKYYTFYSESVKDLGLLDNVLLWNNAKRFKDFETILSVIQHISSLSSKRKQAKKCDDDKVINKLKNVLK